MKSGIHTRLFRETSAATPPLLASGRAAGSASTDGCADSSATCSMPTPCSPLTRFVFGTCPGGEAVEAFTLANDCGASLKVITYGGIITSLRMPDRHGQFADVVLGFDRLEPYLAGHPYFGAIVGRVAGRMTRGLLRLDESTRQLAVNNPPNHLHGGLVGFDKRIWSATPGVRPDGAPQLRLAYRSPAGEEGYPGNVNVAVTYSLSHDNEVTIEAEASTDEPTPLCLTNHSYFNLAGEGSGTVDDHVLQIHADEFVPTDEHFTLLGRREPVAGRGNDFTRARRIGDALPRLFKAHGDLYLVPNKLGPELRTVAQASDPQSGRQLEVRSTSPCVQFYTGVSLDGTLTGKSGRRYPRHAGFCLECQGYPDGANTAAFGDIILRPGQCYRQTTVFAFSVA
jgi:aldose 1-epimerase